MKYCTHCGNRINDDDMYCPSCGARQENYDSSSYDSTAVFSSESYSAQVKPRDNAVYLIAFILCILSTVSMGLLIFPLIWCIPMTIKVYKCYKHGENLSTGFKVCVLLFLNIISGILLLVADEM